MAPFTSELDQMWAKHPPLKEKLESLLAPFEGEDYEVQQEICNRLHAFDNDSEISRLVMEEFEEIKEKRTSLGHPLNLMAAELNAQLSAHNFDLGESDCHLLLRDFQNLERCRLLEYLSTKSMFELRGITKSPELDNLEVRNTAISANFGIFWLGFRALVRLCITRNLILQLHLHF
jgi:hypothetical protein